MTFEELTSGKMDSGAIGLFVALDCPAACEHANRSNHML